MVWTKEDYKLHMRKWRLENPERWKEIKRKSDIKYRENHKEEIKLSAKKYRENNLEKCRERKKISEQKKPEYYKMKNREKMQKNRLKYKVRVYTDNKFKHLKTNCLFCNTNSNLNYHHFVYKTPVELTDFIILCRNCHNEFHNTYNNINWGAL